MTNSEKIKRINSLYNLKLIFSYLDYNHVIKLIKYNKNLQKQLDLNLRNYNNKFNYAYSKKSYKFKYYNEKGKENFEISLILSTSALLMTSLVNFSFLVKLFLCFIYDSIFIILFSINNKIIKRSSQFILLLIFLFTFIILVFVIKDVLMSFKKYSILSKICFAIFCFLYIKGFCAIYIYLIKNIFIKKEINNFFLISFQNIKIIPFKLPKIFHKMKNIDKKHYIINNIKNAQMIIPQEQKEIIDLINILRINNNLPKFQLDVKFQDCYIKEPSELMLFPYRNIFKINSRNYLLKLNKNDLKIKINNNIEIVNVLLNKDLNKINIIEKDNFEYINIYEDIFEENENFKNGNSCKNNLDDSDEEASLNNLTKSPNYILKNISMEEYNA